MKKLLILSITCLCIAASGFPQAQFNPDLSKAYYIDCPSNAFRLAADGGEKPFSTSISTTGPQVQWRFVNSPSDGYYFIECDAGGANPRIRSDQTEFADMVATSAEGSWVRWRTDSAGPGRYFLSTLQDTPYDRLQITADGQVKVDDNLNSGEDLQFTFTLAEGAVSSRSSYHVSKTGNDAGEGSPEEPFLTISKAASLAGAGDTVFIHEGIYRETLNPANSGISGKPIVFTNFGNDSVLIKATEPVTDWQVFSGNIYSAQLVMPLQNDNMLFFEGDAMDRARWPNNTDGNVFTINAQPVSGGTASTITSDEVPDIDWTGGFIWYLGAHSGTSWTRPILSTTSTSVSFPEVDITKWPFSTHNPTVYRNGNRGRFFLFGVMGALDFEREWFYNKSEGKVYFYAPGGADPATSEAEATVRSHCINITRDYIVVQGIDAFGGRVEVNANNCVLRHGEFIHCLQVMDDLDNTSAQSANAAVYIAGNDNLVEYNRIEHSSLSGIYIQSWGGGNRNDIMNNYILHCNSVGIHASPVRSGASNSKVVSNTIRGTGRDGIYCSGTNNEIAYNDVSYCMRINNDGGLYYTVGNDALKNTEIHHNWFHDTEGPSYADGRAAGIYLDNNSKGYDVHHNVVWNISWTGLQINWLNTHINFYHNTLLETSAAIGRWDNNYDEFENRVWNNFSDRGDWSSVDFQPDLKNNVIRNESVLEDFEGKNFIPVANSELVDMAYPIDELPIPFTGTGPDIGAYERGLTPWIPGVHTVYGGEEDTLNYNFLRTAITRLSDTTTSSTVDTLSNVDMLLKLDSTIVTWQVLDTLREENTSNDTLFVYLTFIDSTFRSKTLFDSTFNVSVDSIFTFLLHDITDTILYDSIFVNQVLRSFEIETYTARDTLLQVLSDTILEEAGISILTDTMASMSYATEIIPLTAYHGFTGDPVSLVLYPNPLGHTNLQIEIDSERMVENIAVIDLAGKIVYLDENGKESLVLPRSVFPEAGLYFIRIRISDKIIVRELIVE